jgi:quercetin dioxygenase-like cupin family protein
MAFEESLRALLGTKKADYYAQQLQKFQQFRQEAKKRKWKISAEEMPWENSPQGRIKHITNEQMDTMEFCLDVYQQLLPPRGRSGKHRHMAEELFFVLEGKGYDLHWDPQFKLGEEYIWSWSSDAKKYEWGEEDWVYIPPYTVHQHFNSDPENPARFITATNRIVRAMGFEGIEQLENAPDYKP